MGESQSRFSIIDELVKKKTAAQDSVLATKKDVTDLIFSIAKWEKNVILTREVNADELNKKQDDAKAKIEVLENQVTEYDKAISAIQAMQTK